MGHSPVSLVDIEDEAGDENHCDAEKHDGEHETTRLDRRGPYGSEILVTYDVFVHGVCKREF